jgi:thiol-disulfide isomerase/thioredoxin
MRALVLLLLICNFATAQDVRRYHTPMVAIVWLSPECPLCKNYTKPLNELSQKYAGNLTVVGVFPGHWYTQQDYATFQQKYKVFFPLLTDQKNKLGKQYHATVTPEVCLLDSHRKVVYQGAIDDWATRLGQTKTSATAHYLEDAIINTLAGRAVNPTITKPVGCYINDN